MTATITNPLTCQAAAKSHLVEMIMVLWGQSQPNPQATRWLLEADSFENLRQFYADIAAGRVEI